MWAIATNVWHFSWSMRLPFGNTDKPCKAGVKRELLDTVKAKKLAYYGHTTGKQGNCLETEIMQARKTTHGLDGQHQDMDRTARGGVNQNDRGQR